MAYTIRIEPDASADGIYIELKNGAIQSKQVKVTGQNTILNFDREPEEIIIQRKTSFIKRLFTTFYCTYIEVQSSESVFYFPVFGTISSTKETIAEGSGKLPWQDDKQKRKKGMEDKKNLQVLVGWAPPSEEQSLKGNCGFGPPSLSRNTLSLMSLAEDDSSGIFWELCPEKWKKPSDKIQFAVEETHDQVMTTLMDNSSKKKQSARISNPRMTPQHSSKEKRWNLISGVIHYLLIFGQKISKKLDKIHKAGLPRFVEDGHFLQLPADLWFGPYKLLTVIKNELVVKTQTVLRRLSNFGRRWRKIDDIKRVFLFPSKKAAYIAENWKDDAFFGSQFLNGCNPGMIEKCTKIPEKIAGISRVCPKISELIQNGNIYMVDYELLDNVQEGIIHGYQQYLAAPIVLLQETERGLMPIAIQLKQKPGEENPIFTPKDKAEAWLLAKIWVRNSDFYIHELISHLLRTHLLAEIFFLSIFTSLHDHHPILRIFAATGRYTIPINVFARSTLINDTGFFMEYTGFGKDAQLVVLKRAFRQLTYKSLCLPDNLESRGLQNLRNYHYRDDAMLIWKAISEFLQNVVDMYYNEDKDIYDDEELQNFFYFTHRHGLQGQTDLPERVETKAEAVKYLSMVMFTCSAQHAAVNHGQYDTYAWMPNGPTTMRQPPPMNKDVVDEDYIINTLPNMETTLEGMAVARFLSQATEDFVGLGNYADEVSNDPHLKHVIKSFQTQLNAIGKAIKDRSEKQSFPYEYLFPAGIENSIAI